MRYHNDPALVFFAGASALLLAVSMPATYAVVSPFHSSGDWFGIALALATLAAFEIGAVGCKLVTLAIPAWAGRMNLLTIVLLMMTTVANYANGYDLFATASLSPTLAAIRNAGYASLVTIVYSATIPLLLFVFLSATIARVKQLRVSASAEPSLAEQRDIAIVQALETLTARLQPAGNVQAIASPGKPLALPGEASSYACPHCGAELAKPGLIGLARRYGYCAACKPQNT